MTKVNTAVREVEAAYQNGHADYKCVVGMCEHDESPPALPAGARPAVSLDINVNPLRRVVTLFRFRRREWGGWDVVRADNGRLLGWTVRNDTPGDECKGLWSAHVNSSAFRGGDLDDAGDLMDSVPLHLFHGSAPFESKNIGYQFTRERAAEAIIGYLVSGRAPAVGYGRHQAVEEYYTLSRRHLALGEEGDEHCACGGPWPCPRRAALVEAGK